jgi:hypothetical protein
MTSTQASDSGQRQQCAGEIKEKSFSVASRHFLIFLFLCRRKWP